MSHFQSGEHIHLVDKKGRHYALTLKAGDLAPDFRLPTYDKSSLVQLSKFRGDRPVVLIFGSYT